MFRFWPLLHGAIAALMIATPVVADDDPLIFFRIGNGATSGTYYPIGSIIAAAISNPPGGESCEQGGACGVPGLLASALASAGSVANIRALRDGKIESGFAQADVAHAAQTGQDDWAGAAQATDLRAIAALYSEAIHIVARADAGIATVQDLRGKRVSLNEDGSGTRIDAQIVLDMAGISPDELMVSTSTTDKAARQLRSGDLDAFFFVGGWPSPAISELAGQTDIMLVPIEGELAQQLMQRHVFFLTHEVPAHVYPGIDLPVTTLSVPALWLTRADQPEQLIHDITRVLWNENTQKQLRANHPIGKRILRDQALTGISIQLHPGAARYYREAGLLK